MSMRILRGTSPFHPDRTHLHHIFLELGFSHVGTTVSILTLNLLVVASWYLSYRLGASVDTQFYVVLALSIFVTFVFYKFASTQVKRDGRWLKILKRLGKKMNFEKKGFWLKVQSWVDKL